MRHHVPKYRALRYRPAVAIAATAALSAAVVIAPAASARTQALPSTRFAGPTPGPLLMINGDKLVITPTRVGDLTALIPAPDGGQLISLHLNGSTYEIPVTAMPYFGHGLDPSLFNVALLQRHESGGRLPVDITFAGSLPELPGVTVQSWQAGEATGYLTASSARTFGAALFRQFAAQHAKGSYLTGGLFAGGVDIGLAGAAHAVSAKPQFAMRTLTIGGTNGRGKPDNGDLTFVISADNPARFGDPFEINSFFFHGVTKYSVPGGRYWAIGDFVTFTKTNLFQRLVVVPQFTVSGKSTKLRLDSRAATSEVTISTPRKSVSLDSVVTIDRTAAHGGTAGFGLESFGTPIWISPTTKKPTVGKLRSFTASTRPSPPHAKGAPYAYNLGFAGPAGIVPRQHFVVSPANLATVHERYFRNAPAKGHWSTFGGSLPQLLGGGVLGITAPVSLPGLQTQYMTAGLWESSFSSGGGLAQSDTLHPLQAGRSVTENWNDYPLHPQARMQLVKGAGARAIADFPTAFRDGDLLWLSPASFSDNSLGHVGASAIGRFSVSEDGHQVHARKQFGFIIARVSSKSGKISFTMRSALPNPLDSLSAQTATTWTFGTAGRPKATVPPGWQCVTPKLLLTRKCSVPGMLMASYLVHGLALSGTTPAGKQAIDVTVGHIEPGPQTAIVKAGAQVSYDGGQFWQPATVIKTSAGHYIMTFNPPAGVDITTRFTATDAAGGSIDETITNAYSVGPRA